MCVSLRHWCMTVGTMHTYTWVLHPPASCVHRVPHAVLLSATAQLLKHSLDLRYVDKASAAVLKDPSLALNAVKLGKSAWRGIGTHVAGRADIPDFQKVHSTSYLPSPCGSGACVPTLQQQQDSVCAHTFAHHPTLSDPSCLRPCSRLLQAQVCL